MKQRKVGRLMSGDVVCVTEGTPFKDVAALLARHGISGMPVVDDDDKVVGVVSATDLMTRQDERGGGESAHRRWWSPASRRPVAKAAATTAGQLMSTPPITVHAADSIALSARTMAERRVERLPVVDEEDRLVGIVTRRDLLGMFLRADEDIREEVVQEVLVRTLWLSPHTVDVRVADGVVHLEGGVEQSSEVAVAGSMTAQVDGVVGVVNRLTARFDDSELRPPAASVYGFADDPPRRP